MKEMSDTRDAYCTVRMRKEQMQVHWYTSTDTGSTYSPGSAHVTTQQLLGQGKQHNTVDELS